MNSNEGTPSFRQRKRIDFKIKTLLKTIDIYLMQSSFWGIHYRIFKFFRPFLYKLMLVILVIGMYLSLLIILDWAVMRSVNNDCLEQGGNKLVRSDTMDKFGNPGAGYLCYKDSQKLGRVL